MAGIGKRPYLRDLNPHLACLLCRGYLIDATTVVECLHSFCRSCILKHLKSESSCPACEYAINKAKPNIKADKTLQDIVYKLVPGLYHKEMRRRREFYKKHPEEAESATPEQRGEDFSGRLIFALEDAVSLSLEYLPPNVDPIMIQNSVDNKVAHKSLEDNIAAGNIPGSINNNNSKRYLQCPALVTIGHLKKFLAMKYSIDMSRYNIEIYHTRASLPENWTLIDCAYICAWKRNAPMRFFYRVALEEQKLEAPANIRPSTPGLGASQPPTEATEDIKPKEIKQEEKPDEAKSKVTKIERKPEEKPMIKVMDKEKTPSQTTDNKGNQLKSPLKILKTSNGYEVMKSSPPGGKAILADSSPKSPEFSVVKNSSDTKITLKQLSPGSTNATPKSTVKQCSPGTTNVPSAAKPTVTFKQSLPDSTNANSTPKLAAAKLKQATPNSSPNLSPKLSAALKLPGTINSSTPLSTAKSAAKPKIIGNVLLSDKDGPLGRLKKMCENDTGPTSAEKKRKVSFVDDKSSREAKTEQTKNEFLESFELTAKESSSSNAVKPKEEKPQSLLQIAVKDDKQSLRAPGKDNKLNLLTTVKDIKPKLQVAVKDNKANMQMTVKDQSKVEKPKEDKRDVYTFSESNSTPTPFQGAVKRKCPLPGLTPQAKKRMMSQKSPNTPKEKINIRPKPSPTMQSAKNLPMKKPQPQSLSNSTRNLLDGCGLNIPASLSITLTKSPNASGDEQNSIISNSKMNPSITLNDCSVDPKFLKSLKAGQIKMAAPKVPLPRVPRKLPIKLKSQALDLSGKREEQHPLRIPQIKEQQLPSNQFVTLSGQRVYKAPPGSLTPAVHRAMDIPFPQQGRTPVYAPSCFSPTAMFSNLQSVFQLNQAPSLGQFEEKMKIANKNNHLVTQCTPLKPARSALTVPIVKVTRQPVVEPKEKEETIDRNQGSPRVTSSTVSSTSPVLSTSSEENQVTSSKPESPDSSVPGEPKEERSNDSSKDSAEKDISWKQDDGLKNSPLVVFAKKTSPQVSS